MKLFQNLFAKDNGMKIGAPISGKLVSISEVTLPLAKKYWGREPPLSLWMAGFMHHQTAR